jgi:hypothetical protein
VLANEVGLRHTGFLKEKHHNESSTKKLGSESLLAYSTVVLAIATALLAWFTYRLAADGKEASQRQIGIQTWLELERRFDSSEMKKERQLLAIQFLKPSNPKHEQVSESVLNFFEDVGMLYRQGYINKEMTESSFGFYATRWYKAALPYITEERKNHGNDKTLFDDFENLIPAMKMENEKIDAAEVKRFLEDESRLIPPTH